MRVRLSYSVEEEDVLAETAKIINLSAESLQRAITLFTDVQTELQGVDDEIPNTLKALGMIEEFRTALLVVDTRLAEVIEIVRGYDTYTRQKDHPSDPEADDLPPDEGEIE